MSSKSARDALSQKLLESAERGNNNEVLDLISKGAQVNYVSKTSEKSNPLHAAARNDHVDALNVLLYAGADVNAKDSNGNTSLHIACQNGHLSIAKALLDRGADTSLANLVNSTALHDAAGCGRGDIVHLLVERGANLRAEDVAGRTPRERADVAGYSGLFED